MTELSDDVDDLIVFELYDEDETTIIAPKEEFLEKEFVGEEHLEEVEKVTQGLAQPDKLQKAKRSRLSEHTGPLRFLLFDSLVAEVVDYDEEDNSPIVEFSMSPNDEEIDKLPVECGICPDVMDKSKIEQHVKTHLKPGTKRFICIYCQEDFVSRAYAAGHARRHMGIRPYFCPPCKLYYCTKQDLRVHQQRRHWAKEHICEQCGKTFAQNTSLKNHRTLVHEQQRRFECEQCGKRFLRNYAMKEHVRNVHFGDRRPLDCPFCDLFFKDTHKLAQHRKDMHLHQSVFECRACGLEFTNIDFFDAHRRSLQCRNKYKREEHAQEEQQEPFVDIVKIEGVKEMPLDDKTIVYEVTLDNA